MSNQTTPQPTKDAERLEAERMAVDLAVRVGDRTGRTGQGRADHVSAAARIGAMTDHELRLELYRLRRRVESAESSESHWSRGPSPAQKRSREALVSRYRRLAQPPRTESDVELLDELVDDGITVAEDGLLEIDRITDRVQRLVGATPELPVAMYHHTSSALIEAIRAEGLRVGKPTNFFNTQQGVYVSTIQAGQPVSVYSRRAARVHGGEPITLRLRRKLSEIKPDPDDADLAWAQGRQYITPSVPPEDVMWEADDPQDAARVPTAPAARKTPRPR